jgi:hypothetical protein
LHPDEVLLAGSNCQAPRDRRFDLAFAVRAERSAFARLNCGRSLILFGVHFVDGDKPPLLDLLVCHRRDSKKASSTMSFRTNIYFVNMPLQAYTNGGI